MISTVNSPLQEFETSVGIKFQLYNSLFFSLPFNRIEKTGILLSLFLSNCEEGYQNRQSPVEIIENFFGTQIPDASEAAKIDLLFRFVQYAERQVVLFDALEDAGFSEVNDTTGAGTLKHLESSVVQRGKIPELAQKLEDFSVRLVLTAHPTQFYPGSVLGIINDLTIAIAENNVSDINTLLQQLGRTRFFKKQKPTPFDEAVSLIWYLENVFYTAAGNIVSALKSFVQTDAAPIRMGFWSGGDRDGNPFVTVETTLNTAEALRTAILRSYYREVRELKRRLTFAGVESELAELEQKLYDNVFTAQSNDLLTKDEILRALRQIQTTLLTRHDGLFVHLVEALIDKVLLFGVFFASLDVRQESSIHGSVLGHIAEETDAIPKNYVRLSDSEKIAALLRVQETVDADILSDELAADTLRTINAVKNIQLRNGREACERYIISQCQSALNAIEVYGLFLLSGWRREEISVDIVPLFETITDLQNARKVMRELYEMPVYREHLARRDDTQPIMLGFSDGTKDGGYLMANWSIYKAKEELSDLSREFGVKVVFFDGRGGPPARGGGKTHKFYSSMGAEIANHEIQLTVQGQTVSSNFGTVVAAQYNLEQLLHSGLYTHIFAAKKHTFADGQEELLQSLADESYRQYDKLKNQPLFLDYLSHASPLRFYAETNIGSRPAKRGTEKKLELKDLRAIPFVGAWSQLKQNVPGYYGVGSALHKMEAEGNLDEIKNLYKQNAFFKALMDNCEMAMVKSYFPLTAFLSGHLIYGEIWRTIYDEYELTRKYLLEISGKDELMSDYPIEQQSIQMRERIVLPLTTVQQYALTKVREFEEKDISPEHKRAYEKLVMRCSFGIINAGRNSA
jgi:phosphoenolpyruvate carboxylase